MRVSVKNLQVSHTNIPENTGDDVSVELGRIERASGSVEGGSPCEKVPQQAAGGPPPVPKEPHKDPVVLGKVQARLKDQSERWTLGKMTDAQKARFVQFTKYRDAEITDMMSGKLTIEQMREKKSEIGTRLGQLYGMVDANGKLTPEMQQAGRMAQDFYMQASIEGNWVVYGGGIGRSIGTFTAAVLSLGGMAAPAAIVGLVTHGIFAIYESWALASAGAEGSQATIRSVTKQVLPFPETVDVKSDKVKNQDRTEGKLRELSEVKRDIDSVRSFEERVRSATTPAQLEAVIADLDTKLGDNDKTVGDLRTRNGEKISEHDIQGDVKIRLADLKKRREVLQDLRNAIQRHIDRIDNGQDDFDGAMPKLQEELQGVRGKLMFEQLTNETYIDFNRSQNAGNVREVRTSMNFIGAASGVVGGALDLVGLKGPGILAKGVGVAMSSQPLIYQMANSAVESDYSRKLENQWIAQGLGGAANFHETATDPNSRLDPKLFGKAIRTGEQVRMSHFSWAIKNDYLVHQEMFCSYFVDPGWARQYDKASLLNPTPKTVTLTDIPALTSDGPFKLELTTERLMYAFAKCNAKDERKSLIDQLIAYRVQQEGADPALAQELRENLAPLLAAIDSLAAAEKAAKDGDLDGILKCPHISQDGKDVLVGSLRYAVVYDPKAGAAEKADAEQYKHFELRLIELRTKAESTSLHSLYNFIQKIGQQYLWGVAGQNMPATVKLLESITQACLNGAVLADAIDKGPGTIVVLVANGAAMCCMVPTFGYNKAYGEFIGEKNREKGLDEQSGVVMMPNTSIAADHPVEGTPGNEESRDYFVGFSWDYMRGRTTGLATLVSLPVPRGAHPGIRTGSDKLPYRDPMDVGTKVKGQVTAAEATGHALLSKWVNYFRNKPGKLAIVNADGGHYVEITQEDLKKFLADPKAEPKVKFVDVDDIEVIDETGSGGAGKNEKVDLDQVRFDESDENKSDLPPGRSEETQGIQGVVGKPAAVPQVSPAVTRSTWNQAAKLLTDLDIQMFATLETLARTEPRIAANVVAQHADPTAVRNACKNVAKQLEAFTGGEMSGDDLAQLGALFSYLGTPPDAVPSAEETPARRKGVDRQRTEPASAKSQRATRQAWAGVQDLITGFSERMKGSLEDLAGNSFEEGAVLLTQVEHDTRVEICKACRKVEKQIRNLIANGSDVAGLDQLANLFADHGAGVGAQEPRRKEPAPRSHTQSVSPGMQQGSIVELMTKILEDPEVLAALDTRKKDFQSMITFLDDGMGATEEAARAAAAVAMECLAHVSNIGEKLSPEETQLLRRLLKSIETAASGQRDLQAERTTRAPRGAARVDFSPEGVTANLRDWNEMGENMELGKELDFYQFMGTMYNGNYREIELLIGWGGDVTAYSLEQLFIGKASEPEDKARQRAAEVRDFVRGMLKQWGVVVGDRYDQVQHLLEALLEGPAFEPNQSTVVVLNDGPPPNNEDVAESRL